MCHNWVPHERNGVKSLRIVERITATEEIPEYGYTILEYELLEPEGASGWGLRCRMPVSGEEVMAADVAENREDALRIMRCMAAGTVTPVSFYDILYDLLP